MVYNCEARQKTNLNKIQTYQNITLRKIKNTPPYISNQTLHNDLNMKTIEQESASQAILLSPR